MDNFNDSHVVKTLRARREEVFAEARAIADTAAGFNRNFSGGEQRRYDELTTELDAIDERLTKLKEREQRDERAAQLLNGNRQEDRSNGHPLALNPLALDRLQDAIEGRTEVRVDVAETRATLVTTSYGSPRAWGANVQGAPRLLHVVGGAPLQQVDAVSANLPKLTMPTSQGAVAEAASLGEYDSSTAGAVTLSRYGRWTDLSREALVGADAQAITAMHAVGVAKDLDLALVTALQTDAGTAATFGEPVGDIRQAIAEIEDATGAEAGDLVILSHPGDVNLLQDVSPIGGRTTGEGFNRFSGALVYASSAVTAGIMTVANIRAGVRYFEARGLTLETDVSVKTGVLTAATSVIGGYGIALAGCATAVDVVTP